MGSSPGFLGNPFRSMPRARNSGDPGGTSQYRSARCCLPPCQQRRHRNHRVFGTEPSRPASLLCTLRSHQSPGEWQHSLPACLLDCDRAGLAPAGFHQEVSPLHLRFLLFQAFPSAMTMSALSIPFFLAYCSLHSEERAISLSLKVLPYQPRPARNLFQVSNSVRPMHLFGHTFDHDY